MDIPQPPVSASGHDALFYCKAQLKERGWTDGAIKKFLGDADDTRPNPRYRNAAPTLLWEESKVKQAEASEAFQQWLTGSAQKRKKASVAQRERMAKAREETIALFAEQITKSTETALARFESIEKLERKAIQHWAANKESRQFEPVEIPSRANLDALTVSRWVENYVRHALTNYEGLLNELAGQIGRESAYFKMKECVSASVSAFYKKHSNPL